MLTKNFLKPFIRRPFCRFMSTVDAFPNDPLPVSFEDVSRATYRIRDGIRRTHCDKSEFLSDLCQTTIYLKKDFMQFTGSFKERYYDIILS